MPAIALEPGGRPWIAWESAPQFGEIGGLRAHRELRVAAIEDGVVRHVPASHLPATGARADLPRIACTEDGVLVTARAPGETFVPSFLHR